MKSTPGILGLVVLTGILTISRANGQDKGTGDKGKGLGEAEVRLSDREHAALALFIVEKLEAGVTGEALEAAIRAKLEALRKDHKDDKKDEANNSGQTSNGPGEALKHGLADVDLSNLGKFVNEQLAAGLRGEKLADAIKAELKKLKENRAKERENAKGPQNGARGGRGRGK